MLLWRSATRQRRGTVRSLPLPALQAHALPHAQAHAFGFACGAAGKRARAGKRLCGCPSRTGRQAAGRSLSGCCTLCPRMGRMWQTPRWLGSPWPSLDKPTAVPCRFFSRFGLGHSDGPVQGCLQWLVTDRERLAGSRKWKPMPLACCRLSSVHPHPVHQPGSLPSRSAASCNPAAPIPSIHPLLCIHPALPASPPSRPRLSPPRSSALESAVELQSSPNPTRSPRRAGTTHLISSSPGLNSPSPTPHCM